MQGQKCILSIWKVTKVAITICNEGRQHNLANWLQGLGLSETGINERGWRGESGPLLAINATTNSWSQSHQWEGSGRDPSQSLSYGASPWRGGRSTDWSYQWPAWPGEVVVAPPGSLAPGTLQIQLATSQNTKLPCLPTASFTSSVSEPGLEGEMVACWRHTGSMRECKESVGTPSTYMNLLECHMC